MVSDRRVVACLLAVLVVLAMSWGAGRAEAVTDKASVTIATDTGNQALFSSSRMRPGAPESTCLAVATAQAQYGEVVAVTALDVSGPLAARLIVTVERGTGGGGGSCVGFAGTQVFSGTLAALGASMAGDGVDTGWYAELVTVQVFRITVTVPDDAAVQGLSAAGRFTWLVRPGSDPPTPTPRPTPPAPPTPGPTGPPDPGPPDAGPTDPAPTDPAPTGSNPSRPGVPTAGPSQTGRTSPLRTSPPSATVTPDGTAVSPDDADADTADTAGGAAAGGDGDRPGPAALFTSAEPAATPDVLIDTALPIALTRTLVSLGSEPQYPIAVIIVVLVFLLVQHGIDARDPKLAAAAATQRDNELSFEDPFAPRGPRPEHGAG